MDSLASSRHQCEKEIKRIIYIFLVVNVTILMKKSSVDQYGLSNIAREISESQDLFLLNLTKII